MATLSTTAMAMAIARLGAAGADAALAATPMMDFTAATRNLCMKGTIVMLKRPLANNLIRPSHVLILPAAIARSGCLALVSASTMDLAGTRDATLSHRTALAVNAPANTVQIASREQDGSWIYYNAHAGHRAYRCKIYKPSTLLSVTQGPPNCSLSSR